MHRRYGMAGTAWSLPLLLLLFACGSTKPGSVKPAAEVEPGLLKAALHFIESHRTSGKDAFPELYHENLVRSLDDEQTTWYGKNCEATAGIFKRFPKGWESRIRLKYRVIPAGEYEISRVLGEALGEACDLYEVAFESLAEGSPVKNHEHLFVLSEGTYRSVFIPTPREVIQAMTGGYGPGPGRKLVEFGDQRKRMKEETAHIEWKDLH